MASWAIVDSDGNGYLDRIYIGTDKGYLYKVNIPDDPEGFIERIKAHERFYHTP